MTETDLLARQLERAMRLYQAISYTDDLRPAQWQALRFFATAPAEKRTLVDFAHARASTIGTTSITVTALVNQGLMARSRPDRNVGLRVTELGERYLEEGDPAKRLSHAISEMRPEQQQALDVALAQLINSLESSWNGGR